MNIHQELVLWIFCSVNFTLKIFNQSKCFKISVALNLHCKIFIGLGPVYLLSLSLSRKWSVAVVDNLHEAAWSGEISGRGDDPQLAQLRRRARSPCHSQTPHRKLQTGINAINLFLLYLLRWWQYLNDWLYTTIWPIRPILYKMGYILLFTYSSASFFVLITILLQLNKASVATENGFIVLATGVST